MNFSPVISSGKTEISWTVVTQTQLPSGCFTVQAVEGTIPTCGIHLLYRSRGFYQTASRSLRTYWVEGAYVATHRGWTSVQFSRPQIEVGHGKRAPNPSERHDHPLFWNFRDRPHAVDSRSVLRTQVSITCTLSNRNCPTIVILIYGLQFEDYARFRGATRFLIVELLLHISSICSTTLLTGSSRRWRYPRSRCG